MWSESTSVALIILIISLLLGFHLFYHTIQERPMMAQTGLLVVSNVARAHTALTRAAPHIINTLYISFSGAGDHSLPLVSKQIVNIYTKSTSVCSSLDVRLLLQPLESRIQTRDPVQLVLLDSGAESDVTSRVDNLEDGFKVLNLDVPESAPVKPAAEVKLYDYVALGGTFDRLHNGHKILLSEAALRARKHLTVGVTDTSMIQSKKLWELIEPLEQRIQTVQEFLQDVRPGLDYNVVPLQDMYGPTRDDPRLQLLVVSEETARAGPKINEKRAQGGLSPMELYCIDLVPDEAADPEEEGKVSSSNRRMRLLGTMLRPPRPNPNIPKRPYILGLTGGIASGKTKITERLKAKGAAVVNCDLIAHDLYQPGLPLNATIAETFGPSVIATSGEVDRKRLGQIVFNDKAEMERLNRVMWPAIIEEAERRARALGAAGHAVVVLEAAVLVQARWHERVHQLWAAIVPPDEAVKRLMERNGLSEEQAHARVQAQPPNSVQVAEANVVFSPYWSYEYTQAQVDRAWDHLQHYLNSSDAS